MSHAPLSGRRPAPGSPFPLGATVVDGGVQFAVHAPDAERVDVCLVDGGVERRIELTQQTYGIWHGSVAGIAPGQRYGYRAHGPWEPRRGVRFNPHKLLLDPYAHRIDGALGDAVSLAAYEGTDPFGPPSDLDSIGHVPLSVVTTSLAPPSVPRLETPWEETVLLELHVGSYTARHPDLPPPLRGTYRGLAADPVLDHLSQLGVTAVELLPVQAFLTEAPVRARGMRNHWGYSTAGFFAPHPGYASVPGAEVDEFRYMVDLMHTAGIEVILDVVYNHTCESSIAGPTISFRGLDAPGYYALADDGTDVDITGCGNTVNCWSPAVVRMVCDSLRYWRTTMGVDGFRFDLAPVLGRDGAGAFDERAPLLSAITSDPALRRCKLIAEPWDATAAGYQLGRFGIQWSEWNDRFRDDTRRFWIGESGVRDIASRLAGSQDIFGASGATGNPHGANGATGNPHAASGATGNQYRASGRRRGLRFGARRPWASVNFVTAHDGFTLSDLVSYERKHNRANGEEGRDGATHNLSMNHGHEGPARDATILARRGRHVRALLATLLLSTGTPMLLAGDELGHSQRGNNNAYCVPADTPVVDSWPVHRVGADPTLTEYVARLTALRRDAPALRQPEFFTGRDTPTGNPDLVWFDGTGTELDAAGWADDGHRTLQMWIDGSDVRSRSASGRLVGDTSWLLVLHAGDAAEIVVGAPEWLDADLELVLDSAQPDGAPTATSPVTPGTTLALTGPTFLALRAPRALVESQGAGTDH